MPCTDRPAAIPFSIVGWTGSMSLSKSDLSYVMEILVPVSMMKVASSGVKCMGKPVSDAAYTNRSSVSVVEVGKAE